MSEVLFSSTDDLQSWRNIAEPVLDEKLSFITISDWVAFFMRTFCKVSLSHSKRLAALELIGITNRNETMLPLASQDENAKTYLNGFIFNGLLSQPLERTRRALRRAVQGGLPDVLMKFISDTDTSTSLFTSEKGDPRVEDLQQCMSNVIFTPDDHPVGVKLANLRNFPLYALRLLLLSLFILLVEMFVDAANTYKATSHRKIHPRSTKRFSKSAA